MKLMIASDIHGSAYYCEKLLAAYASSGAERLVLLGDLLYHGPRNDLPRDYAPKQVIAMLAPLADRLLCVRGNCEAEVDQMVLPFPVLSDTALILSEGISILATHGHHASEQNPPPMPRGSVLLCGHTHVAKAEWHEGFLYLNPGSVSIPKEGTGHGYLILEGTTFRRLLLEGDGVTFEVTV